MFYKSKYGTPYVLTHRKGAGGMVLTALPQWVAQEPILNFKIKLYAQNEGLNSSAIVQKRGWSKESVGDGQLPLEGYRYTLVYACPFPGHAPLPTYNVVCPVIQEIGLDLGFSATVETFSSGVNRLMEELQTGCDQAGKKLPPAGTYYDMKAWRSVLKGEAPQGDPELPPGIAELFNPK